MGSILFQAVFPQAGPFPKERYRELLTKLRNDGYAFAFPFEAVNSSKTAVIINDVDFEYSGANSLSEVEREFGVRSWFFLRVDAAYFSQSIKFFKGLENEGWVIGFQYDSLSRADGNMTFAAELFSAQVVYIRSFFNVSLTTYHGDNEYNVSILNFELFQQNPELWQSLALKEVYSLQNFTYVRDTNRELVVPEQLGDLVLVQLHTNWW